MKLPQKDLELIEEMKEQIQSLLQDGNNYWETLTGDGTKLLSIITRQQQALDEAVEQRNAWIKEYRIASNEAVPDCAELAKVEDKLIQAILDGAK